MLFLIPFYITIGSGFVIAINQSQILTYIRHTYYGHMEELSINNPQALNYYRQAQEKAQNGLIEEAHQLLSNAIKLENDNAYLHSEMAQIKFSKQHINEGLSHVNKAIELEPDQYRYRGQRAWAFLHEKRLDTLKNELIALRQLTPRNALMHFMWAHLCIENKEFEKACIYADSAKTLCNNYYLSQEIDRFRHNNCGSRRFFNLIKPYDTDMLASSIFYYYKTYQTKANGEPDVENGIPPKGNFTRQEIKQHIKRNYKFFLKQEIEFIYMYENEQNILIVIRGENCSLSKRTLKYIFVEPNLFKNFQLKVIWIKMIKA